MKILETHIVPAISEKIRLQEYAISIFTSIQSRSGLKKAIKKGLININGHKANTADWIQEGQKIELLQPELSGKKIFKLNFEVLYEDEFIAVIQKPPGYPTSGNFFKTIENALPYNLSPSQEIDILPYPLPAHRLDNPTSGILLCAKTKNALTRLQKDFSKKKIEKTYFAIIHGEITENLKINAPIGGKTSKTIVHPVRMYLIEENTFSMVALKPLTGRTHQLRIHLSENNTPIVGDSLYGKGEIGYFKGKNLYLFAGEISFNHPVLNEFMQFKLPLPKRFRNLDYYRAH